MKQKYFKITDMDKRSCRAEDPKYIIQYYKDKWSRVQIENSLSLVFDSIENARDFIKKTGCSYEDKIWICEVRELQKIKILCDNTRTDFVQFWNKKNKTLFLRHLLDCDRGTKPDGTYGCTSLKLIKELT